MPLAQPGMARTEPKVELRILRPGIARSSAAGAPVKNRHAAQRVTPLAAALKRNGIRLNCDFALACCLSMIFSENRYPLFGIML
jgi:hypothetical protein